MFNAEGIFEKINRLQDTLDELNARIILLSENSHENLKMLESRLAAKLAQLKQELKTE